MDGGTKIALCGHAVHFHFPCPNIQFTGTHAGTYAHILTHTQHYPQITLTHQCTNARIKAHTISFTPLIKLVYSHILFHLHTRSFSQSCSNLHPVFFQQTVSCT